MMERVDTGSVYSGGSGQRTRGGWRERAEGERRAVRVGRGEEGYGGENTVTGRCSGWINTAPSGLPDTPRRWGGTSRHHLQWWDRGWGCAGPVPSASPPILVGMTDIGRKQGRSHQGVSPRIFEWGTNRRHWQCGQPTPKIGKDTGFGLLYSRN